MMLNQYGLVKEPNDIDILVDLHDITEGERVFNGLGEKEINEADAQYDTVFFNEYVIGHVDCDVMAGFRINHAGGVFCYPFDEHSVSMWKVIDGVRIPFMSLEDWYVIYQLIPHRESKVDLIEDYLRTHGVKHPLLLERLLNENLPEHVKKRTKSLLDRF